jgi:hypothetical protein
MKEGSLFCFVAMMLQIKTFLMSLEGMEGGVRGLSSMTFELVVQKFLNIECFLH